MLRAYKYRLYPTKGQARKLNKTFGCCRFVWNKYVETFNSYDKEKNPTPVYPELKPLKSENTFLKEVSNQAMNFAILHFDQFKKQYFSKERKGEHIGRPKFHNRRKHNSFTIDYGSPGHRFAVDAEKGKIRLEKIGWVKYVNSQDIPENGIMRNITVSRNACGQYYASVLVDVEIKHLPKTGKSVGIDLGLKDFAVTSENEHISNPRYLRENQTKIARLQMWQAKKRGSKKGEAKSRRWLKLQGRINRIYNHLTNQRSNFLHNLSTRLVREYDVICLEDLNVKGMMQNHKLAKSMGDASWSMFNTMLNYKAGWYGKEIKRVSRFFASSKTCSCCGHKIEGLSLSDRVFACPVCGLEIDRDFNAAVNIKNKSVGNDADQRTLMGAVTNPREAFITNNSAEKFGTLCG